MSQPSMKRDQEGRMTHLKGNHQSVIRAQKRVLEMCLGIIWANARARSKKGKELDLLLTDGKSLITAGEAINHITQALRLKVKG